MTKLDSKKKKICTQVDNLTKMALSGKNLEIRNFIVSIFIYLC